MERQGNGDASREVAVELDRQLRRALVGRGRDAAEEGTDARAPGDPGEAARLSQTGGGDVTSKPSASSRPAIRLPGRHAA